MSDDAIDTMININSNCDRNVMYLIQLIFDDGGNPFVQTETPVISRRMNV